MPDTAGLGDLWIRASRVCELCTISIEMEALPPGWRIVVRPRRTPDTKCEGVGPHLLEALAIALNRAEVMGFVPAQLWDERG